MYGESNRKLTLAYVKIDSQQGICYMSQRTQIGARYQPRDAGWGERWEGGFKGGNICVYIYMADSC